MKRQIVTTAGVIFASVLIGLNWPLSNERGSDSAQAFWPPVVIAADGEECPRSCISPKWQQCIISGVNSQCDCDDYECQPRIEFFGANLAWGNGPPLCHKQEPIVCKRTTPCKMSDQELCNSELINDCTPDDANASDSILSHWVLDAGGCPSNGPA